MSDKNAEQDSGAQWTKAPSLTKQQIPVQNLSHGSIYEHPILPPSLALYGGNSVPHPVCNPTYAAARFQPPAMHHITGQQQQITPNEPTPALSSHIAAPPAPVPASNVPVIASSPSGFVPPSFSTNAAVSSVLTQNPFAVSTVSTAAIRGNVNHPHFGIDQFSQLSSQQQFELNKIVASFSSSTSGASVGLGSAAATVSVGGHASSTMSMARHHTELSGNNGAGAISSTIVENILNVISAAPKPNSSITAIHGRLMSIGVKVPNDEKMMRVKQMVESGASEQSKQEIVQILDRISTLKPVEKLLLYLRLPTDAPETDPLRQPQNPLGTRSEISHTINWVRTHLEHDPQVSIPKQDVYNDYIEYCARLDIKPLSTADFGKVMKQVFPGIRPRRLGTRGHSRYCYAAMRKTTKLIPPQLPQLGSIDGAFIKTDVGHTDGSSRMSTAGLLEADPDAWETIKNWAENLLKVKVENAKDLAAQIVDNERSRVVDVAVKTMHSRNARSISSHKKYGPREPKEKRLLVDIGPLKKRRKKKRKGSSSSESSWNQPTKVKNNSSDDSKNLSPAKLTKSAPSEAEDQQPLNIDIDKIKQEILDSPNFRQVSHVSVPVVRTQTATVADSYLLQQQILPMNLATEQRGVEAALAKVSTSQASAFGTINSLRTPAIKNLTTKIMELSSPDAPVVNAAVPQISIKEEVVVEDYNTANIFCKKKRKAEQTKGFWVNSPTPATANSVSPAVLPSSPTVSNLIVTSSTRPPSSTETVTSYLMGPPAQASGISSHSAMIGTSGSLAQDIGTSGHTPRVVSRNMLQLRAKRIQLAAAEAAADLGGVVKDADLPENLGLPRERVISICNMDKHELDGYFLPGEIEEENSTDQDTAHELLQYFQMGDAEEKLKSLDDAKQRIPTSITNTTTTNKITTHILANERKRNITNKKQDVVMNVLPVVSKLRNDVDRNSNSSLNVTSSGIVSKLELPMGMAKSGDSASLEKQNVPAVGSASASLALMSKKHQQQQQEQQFKSNTNATNKGKGNATNALNIAPINKVNTPPTRKNCIFFPISPNINSVTSKCSSTTNNGIFASPDVVRLRPKPSFNKQNSLESTSGGSSDPMIGASRRRRIYNNNNLPSTSASAPPSPSLFQQQQQQHQFFCNQFSTAWQLPSTDVGFSEGATKPVASNALLSEQNSLDLDLFGTTTGANTSFTNNSFNIDSGDYSLNGLSETQRSQSVPLSQLQRNHSPTFNRHNLHMNNYGTSHSVVQSTVPHDFADSTILYSENSCSQHSGSMPPQLKLEEAAVLSSDSTAILRELEFNDMLSSPELVAKFSHIEHANTATTTCSSSGSSSGYSSGTCTKFTNGNISGGLESGIVSRSVPSTPLPYHCQNLFGSSGFYGRRREANSGNLDAHLSPIATSQAAASFHSSNAQTQFDRNFRNARLAYDISKSMPTTPITTPCFRYSPTDFNRDFLINGNTIDSISSSFGGMSNENMVNGNGEHIDVNILNSDALIENDADVSVDMLTANASDSIIVDTDLLANL